MEQHSTVTVNGEETFFYCEGTGPAVVMLHGMAATSECWRFTFDALKEDYTVIAPDLPGHGRSEGKANAFNLGHYVRWVGGLLDALNLDKVTLMGNSMGGAVSLAYAKAHPERIERLVLVNPLGVSGQIPWDSGLRLLRRAPHWLALMVTGKTEPHLFNYLRGFITRNEEPPQREILTRMMKENIEQGGIKAVWAGLSVLLNDFATADKRQGFTRANETIEVPTLITWGKYDGLLPVRHATEAKARMPNARIEILPHSAHMPMLDEPERFEKTVRTFFNRANDR